MSQFERSNRLEGQERARESKETKEDQEEKKLAARERVEVVSREVKSTKQQIQNIVGNMQMVMKAVAAIRAQLKLAQTNTPIPSIQRDEKALDTLHKRLANLHSEIKDLKQALVAEERKNIEEEHVDWTADAIAAEAAARVAGILKQLEIEE